jgi:hypothetical protein
LKNDIPFFTLAGYDRLAVETLEFYLSAASKEGCNSLFIEDLKELIADFNFYVQEEPNNVKLPD